MFFVLTTGRSGSQTMARVLSQSPDCVCPHEPDPSCWRSARDTGKDASRRLNSRERCGPPDLYAGDGFVYGESHNRLALAIPALRAAFPRAQYVWLVRDGRDFVCSALQRAWFDEPRPDPAHHRLERTRLRGDRVGAVDPERWRRWDAFRKCCWTRAFCNALIRRELRGLGASAHGPVQLESLETEIDALARCLGILPPPAEWQVERANARVEGQAEAATDPLNRVSRRLHWREWSTAQQAAFEELCGEQMDALYPGWRSTTTSLFKPQCRRLRAPDTDRVDLRGI